MLIPSELAIPALDVAMWMTNRRHMRAAGGSGDGAGAEGDGRMRGGLLAVAQHHAALLPDGRDPGGAAGRRPLAHRPRVQLPRPPVRDPFDLGHQVL